MSNNKFVVVDLETNGNSPKKGDRIIQFAAVVIENGEIVEEYSSFVNPLQPISPFIAELTGITDEMVESAPIFDEIAEKVKDLLEDAYFVAHNVLFDLSFLNEELEQAGFRKFYGPILDTVELARILYPSADGYKLTDLAQQEGLTHSRPHQADSDAFVTAELLLLLISKLSALPLQTLKQLEILSTSLKSDLDIYLQALIEEKQSKVEYIPEHLEIIRGLTLRKDTNSKRKPIVGKGHTEKFEIDKIQERLALNLKTYRKRTGQLKMMESIHQAFQEEKHGLIEAGTGVGKTLGYLIPAAYFAVENKKQIIISTYTTQLQEQLVHKDIPILEKILPFELSYTVLKGRNHYISLDKFEVSLKEQEDNYDIVLTKMQILIWLTETVTGDKDELNLTSGGIHYWNKIKNDGSFSLAISKEWAPKDFYKKTRNAAQKANIIITNHSLLVKDLTLDHKVLPPYDYALVDEGHHFEKTATKHIGAQLSYASVRLNLNTIGTIDSRQLFSKLESIIGEEVASSKRGETNRNIQELQIELEEFFRAVLRYLKRDKGKIKEGRTSYRIESDGSHQWKNLKHVAERMVFLWKDCREYLLKSVDIVLKDREKHTATQILTAERIQSIMNDWEDYMNLLRDIFLKERELIAWVEADFQKNYPNNAVIYTQPYSIADILCNKFFNRKKSIVFTSATMTVNNSFDYYSKLLGLNEINHMEVRIDSPFNYNEQVELLIPTDIPEINSVAIDVYTEAISNHIIEIAKATKGRMLVLYTANDMLKKSYDFIKDSGKLEEYAILAQGITTGSRMRLTRNFQRYEKAILLGTNSFWEGIDIPGEDLTCLVIVRLPFSSPEEPLSEAKNELIKKRGGNPFLENSLPEAVLRFKQGFGRLVRTEEDRGFIVVFDRRILSNSYGELFMHSIPKVPVKKQNINEMIEFIEHWL